MPEESVNLNGGMEEHDALDREMQTLLRGKVGACPPPDRLFAAMEEVLPEPEGAAIRAHAATCPLCQTLLVELDPRESAFTPGVNDRIRTRVDAEREVTPLPARKPGWSLWKIAAAAVVAVGLAAGAWWMIPHQSDLPPVAENAPAPKAAPAPVEVAEMTAIAPLAPPTGVSLITRGAHSAGPTVEEMLPAFRAYNRADYAAAAKDFSALTRQYPSAEIPLLYLGVAQLESGANSDALATLEKAKAIEGSSYRAAAAWYLGVAQLRNDKKAQAADTFTQLCAGPTSPYTSRSCELAKQFTAQ